MVQPQRVTLALECFDVVDLLHRRDDIACQAVLAEWVHQDVPLPQASPA